MTEAVPIEETLDYTLYQLRDDDGTVIGNEYRHKNPEIAIAESLRAKARNALAANNAYIAAGGGTTPAQRDTQIRTLTRECNALIRLLLQLLDTDDA
jgi:hypothetical protein